MVAPAAPRGDDRYNYGPSLGTDDTGRTVLRYVSPSSLDTADARADGGCPRKWYFERVLKKRPPSTSSQELGTKCHAEIEHYFKTGEDVLGAIVRRGLHMIDAPGPDLVVEWALCPPPPGYDPRPLCGNPEVPPHIHDPVLPPEGIGQCRVCDAFAVGKPTPIDPARSFVKIDGTPVVAYLDLAHGRAINVGGDDITDTHDPAGTWEVKDWKFLGDPHRYAKSADAVSKATPMLIYGRGVANALASLGHKAPDEIRLSHCYFGTKERDAFKRTRRVALPVIDERMAPLTSLVRELRDIANEADADRVPGNTRACGAFRGCPHRTYCNAGQRGSLERLFGKTPTPKEDPMSTDVRSVLAGLPGLVAAQTAPASQPAPAPVAVTALQAAPPLPQAQAATPLTAPVVPPAGVGVALTSPAFDVAAIGNAWRTIIEAGVGEPTLTGQAMHAKAALYGIAAEGHGYMGNGQIAGVRIDTVEQLFAIAKDLEPLAAQRRAAAPMSPGYQAAVAAAPNPTPIVAPVQTMPAILPSDAPASNPAISALPVQPSPAELANATFPAAATAAMATMQAAQAAQAAAQVTSVATAAPQPMEQPPVEGAKPKGKGGRKKADAAAVTAGRKGGETMPDGRDTTLTADVDGIELYVDCIPDAPYANLEGLVQEWCDYLAREVGGVNCADIRCAPQDSLLGFNKWPGVLSAFVRESVEKVPAGRYVLRARGSAIGECVAEALRSKVDTYVRGL